MLTVRCIVALASLVAFAFAPEAAENAPCDLVVSERIAVTAVTDGGRFDLADGRHVRLAGIQAPLLSLGRTNISDWPLADDARENLSKLVVGTTLGLAFDGRGVDRHGDVLAYAFLDEKKEWLEAVLVDAGMARVQTRSGAETCAAKWLQLENVARLSRRGIWSNPFYRVRTPAELDSEIGTFQIVEGKILSAGESRDRVFLNFGSDYRTDFTVTISQRDRRRLNKDGVDPLRWQGKTVRVRGWLSLLNGPELELTHAAQIEILK